MPLGKQGPLAKAVTSGVGLFQEYQAESKARKASTNQEEEHQQSNALDPSKAQYQDSSEDDEEWAQDLDAAQTEYDAQQPQDDPNETVDDVVHNFVAANPPPPYTATHPLHHPVILPQRRPGVRSRGFVRGYAPALNERGIPQAVWLDFLTGFEKAIGKNRWFHVLNLAVWVADKIHLALVGISLIARAVAAFIHISLEMSRRGYIHAKQNKYLDKMNDEYFKPRGLYALIVKYKPKKEDGGKSKLLGRMAHTAKDAFTSDPEPIEMVDVDANIVQAVEKREQDEGKFWKGLMKAASSKTTHEEEIPEAAPLIFPYLDTMSEADKQNAVKQKGAFLSDYYDRRAQHTFSMDNPDSKLADVAPRKEWASEYADPSNPKSKGGLLETVSGGHMQSPSTRIMNRRRDRRGRFGIGGDQLPIERRQEKRTQKKASRPMKKMMRQDALYLMVVDMPTQEEMDAVKAAIESLADEA